MGGGGAASCLVPGSHIPLGLGPRLHWFLVISINLCLPPFTEREAGDNCLLSLIPWGNFEGPPPPPGERWFL